MSEITREEIEEMVARWVEANRAAGESGDWSKMSQFYTEDALYTWNCGPRWEFKAEGRQQIHDWVFGTEMSGLETWTYPYVRTLIDDKKCEFIGIWRQLAPVQNAKGEPFEIAGTGGSWFRYAGDFKWSWQRDFFDHINAGSTFGAMAKENKLTPEMLERMKKGSKMPGWTPRTDFDWFKTIVDIEA